MKGFERMKTMKMNHGLCGLVSLTLALISMTTFAAPEVTDVVAKQRYPWNGLVDITCRVAGINGTTNGLKFAVAAVMPDSDAARKVWNFWTVQGGTNSTDRMVRTNGNYRLLWDAKEDLGQVLNTNMVVRVTLETHGKVQLWAGGPYWAETNIGADVPWEYGYHFWWGDTVGYKRYKNVWVPSDGSSWYFSFSSGNTPTYGKSVSTLQSEGWITADSVLAPEHDAAYVQWGGAWRMPTVNEMADLNSKCDWTWTTMNGVNGYVVKGKGDYASASIFLPCAGYGNGGSLNNAGSDGRYWSSEPYSDSYNAWYRHFDSSHRYMNINYRYIGRSVRPVAAMAGYAGDSAPFMLDTMEGTRVAKEVETITYSTVWENGTSVRVALDGVTLKEAVAPASGDVVWNAASADWGTHTLTHTTYTNGVAGKVETVTFRVKGIITVTFDANGGSLGEASPTRSVAEDDPVGELPAPTRTGYTFSFSGWWTSPDGGTQIFASTVPIGNETYQITYYAHWTVNQYTVTFDANGGTGGTSGKQDYGSAIVAPTVTRTGYTFTGWSPSVAATVPTNDVTYTAQWRVNQYTITFNANGGTGGKTVTQDYGTDLSAPAVTQIGYTLMGWSPSVPSTMPAESRTYTAQWQINQYTVTFDANGGTGGTSGKQDYGSAIVAPTVTRTGYTFTGWSPSVAATVPASNVTYTAQWQVNQYTATFDANGGTGGIVKTQDYGTSLSAPTVTRTGYTLTGWSPSVPSTMPAESRTYTAQWQINQYMVTFDANGGIGGWSRTLDYGSAIVAPVVTLDEWHNYTWSPAVAATVPANNVTYTAQWKRYGASISADAMYGKTLRDLFPDDYATMTTVVLEDGITELPAGFFDGCAEVVDVTWPSTLLEFGIDDLPPKILASLAFDADGFKIYNNWVLDFRPRNAAAVAIPEGIVGIGRGAFAEMYDLESVTMPESLKCIASGAFQGCTWIQEFQFMSGLRYVGPLAFNDCSSLLRATFADGVESIGAEAFLDCWKMQSVRLPSSVTNVGVNAFSGCGNIRGVTVPTQVKTMQEFFPDAYALIETAEVAEGEKAVMDGMFAGCAALRGGATQTDMSMIPSTVTNIGARAFQNCTSLTAFVLPDSVTAMGESAFSGCESLWNVTLSRNLAALPDYAFYGCSMLETMIVPASVTYLGNRFFSGRTDPSGGDVIENALYYLGNAPDYDPNAYAAISGNMTTYVVQDSRSWDGRQGSRVLPQLWNGYPITYWTPNIFDVVFDANGGRFDASGGSTWTEQQITDTGYALPTAEPVRPGWAFEGWWTEQTGGAEVRYTTLVTATRTHTLYAHWRVLGEGMTVTFNSCGGTVTPGSQEYVPGQTFGQFPVPARRGYAFRGWWTEMLGGILMTEATEVPAADMELFAHWEPITYLVRFNANGGKGTMADQVITYDDTDTLMTHEFTRTGFAFSGWATTPSGQVRYAENATVANLEEVQDKIVNLYAVWSGAGYSVRFDANGGTGVMENQTIAVGETQNLWPCAFARGGYTFTGWALSPTDAANGTVAYRDGASVKNLATASGAVVPLYAVWAAEGQTVRIAFDANGGSVAPEYWDCVAGTAVEAFPAPTRPGYTFEGWFTAKSGGTLVSSIASVAGAQTFYAHWTDNGGADPGDGTCTVTFNPNGGSVAESTRTVESGEAVGELPVPVRTGYAFNGWFTAAEGGVQVSASTVVSSDVTYYAQWERVELPVITPGDGAVFHTDTCTVTITSATPGAAIYYSSNGRTPTVNARYLYSGPFTISGTATITAFAVKNGVQSDYVDATITYAVPVLLTLKGVLDEQKLGPVTTGGEAEWSPVEDTTAKVGGSCAVSGEVPDDDDAVHSTWLKTTVNGQGTFSFWWRVDCEPDPRGRFTYDYGSVTIDGNVVARKDGTTEWMSYSVTFDTDGEHEIVWTYVSDGYPADAGDFSGRMWVDGVSWSGEANPDSPVDPIPEINGDAEVAGALAGSADARLGAYITTEAEYNTYRGWVEANGLNPQTVKDSPHAWLSYALDAGELIERVFKGSDISIVSFKPTGDGVYALTVEVAGIVIGTGAKADNLSRIFSVVGTTSLDEAFEAGVVTATLGVTADGKLSIVAVPRAADRSLFLRVQMRLAEGESQDYPVGVTFTVTFDAGAGEVGETSREVVGGTAVGTLPIPTYAGYTFLGWCTGLCGEGEVSAGMIVTSNVTYHANWIANSISSGSLYCVIDLSAGASASSYPVTYMDTPPSGGFNTDEYKTTKLVLRRIDPGSFKMCGSYDATLTKAFYCGIFEVTQKQYSLVMGANPSYYTGDKRPVERVSYDTIRGSSSGANWPSSSAVDSSSFMGKLRARTGINGFDLPTEAQWEYACRAGTTSDYNNGGSSASDLRLIGRYDGNTSDGKGGYSQSTIVGSYYPNAWGLYDMHGNVWEWCLDWYDDLSSGGADPKGASSGYHRVERGGAWIDDMIYCTSSSRYGSGGSSYVDEDYVGFRLVQNVTSNVTSLTYTVTFDANGGSGDTTITLTRGSTLFILPTATRPGYAFGGWWTAANGGTQVTASTIVTANVTYYAHWTANSASDSALYCVIDLSPGANASSYPVTYMDTPPSGGFNTDEYKTTKLVLRRIEPGSFMMCDEYDVTLTKPFYCGIFEVTQRQYELVTGNRPSYFMNTSYYATRPVEKVSYNMIRGSASVANWPSSSAVDADSFMGKLRSRTGIDGFDLPTEAQWEYACRAGTTSKYNNGGDSEDNLKLLGRYWDNGGSVYSEGYSEGCTTQYGTAAVGSYLPNAWGLYDMHGNVWEWCLDWYGSRSSGVTDPQGPSSGSCRVPRGGGSSNRADYCTSSSWGSQFPSHVGNSFGFRLVRTLEE